jgi:hypothetical protein
LDKCKGAFPPAVFLPDKDLLLAPLRFMVPTRAPKSPTPLP